MSDLGPDDPAVAEAIEHARMLSKISFAVLEDPMLSLELEIAEVVVKHALRLRRCCLEISARRP